MKHDAGTIIQHYEIIENIQANDLFERYLAYDFKNLQSVQVCVLLPHIQWSDEGLEEFGSYSATNLFELNHIELLPIISCWIHEGCPYIIYQNTSHQSLRDVLLPIYEKIAASYVVQILKGLEYLHQDQVCHGLLSPDTIIVHPGGNIQLLLSGFEPIIRHEIQRQIPETVLVVGCNPIQYLAPEIIPNGTPASPSDLYAIGVLYYEMLTASVPYSNGNTLNTIIHKQDKLPEWQKKLPVSISNPSIRFIQRSLAINPTDRWKTASEAHEVLKSIATGKRRYIRVKKKLLKDAPLKSWALIIWISCLFIIVIGGCLTWKYSDPRLQNDVVDAVGKVFPSSTLTITFTPSLTPTLTFTPSLTNTPTLTHTPTHTYTFTSTRTYTPSVTPTPRQDLPVEDQISLIGKFDIITSENIKNLVMLYQTSLSMFSSNPESVTAWGYIDEIAFSPDNKYVAVGSKNGKTSIWSFPDNSIVDFDGHLASGQPFYADSQNIVVAITGNLERINIASGKRVIVGGYISGSKVNLVDSDRIVLNGSSKKTNAWDSATFEAIKTTEIDKYGCRFITLTDESRLISVISGVGILQDWDDTYQAICETTSQLEFSFGDLSQDRKALVFYNKREKLINVVNTQTNEQKWQAVWDHPVSSLSISSDGSIVVTISSDNVIGLWDGQTGDLLTAIELNKAVVARISPDRKLLVAYSSDGMFTVYGIPIY